MKTVQVYLNSIQKVNSFSHELEQFDNDFDLVSGRYIVDAKSVMGIFSLGNTSVSLMPDVDMPYLMVSATYENAGPESVEKSVTTLIEDALVSLSNLKEITSTSSEGISSVLLNKNGSPIAPLANITASTPVCSSMSFAVSGLNASPLPKTGILFATNSTSRF